MVHLPTGSACVRLAARGGGNGFIHKGKKAYPHKGTTNQKFAYQGFNATFFRYA
jgi:hypothetical protein